MTDPSQPQTVHVPAAALTLTAHSVSVKIKANLAQRHLGSARMFADRCTQIEDAELSIPWPQPRFDEAGSFAVGAVVLAAAALEASINELYLEAADQNTSSPAGLDKDQMSLLATLWGEVDRFSILGKYDLALAACGKANFDKGKEPYQSAASLVDLRNALIHFKPEWDTEQDWHRKLENRLTTRFPQSKLTVNIVGNLSWFPARCLGGGCAKWACAVVKEFADDFCARLGIPQRFP
jgi:hypothetical protein